MDRGKVGTGRVSKNKITPHPSDFIALGTKNSRGEVPETKRPNALAKPGSSSGSIGNDRKKEGPPIQSAIPAKKPKLASAAASTALHTSTAPPRPIVSYTEVWEGVAIDCDPADLVPLVLEANESDDGEKLIGLVCGAIKNLKSSRWKPDNVVTLGLLYLVKIRPSIFSHHCILHALASLLKRDQAHTFKNKGNPMVPVLVANLLMKGFSDKKEWPDVFIKIYIEDALGERVWVDNEECKGFVDNILTGFNTRIPPKSVLQPEGSLMTPKEGSSPSTFLEDEDSLTITSLIQMSGDREKMDFAVCHRYAHCMDAVENIVVETVKEQLNRRQPETITRNFLKLLSSACGFVEIRNVAVPRLEVWLHNPKLMRTAQELLSYICYNCTSHTQRDVEVISQLVKMRLKTKAVINLYLNGVKEIIGLHPGNLSTILKHTVYNELSTTRNTNNFSMLGVMFQTAPEPSAQLLGEIFQDLLLNREDYLRPLRGFLREVVRVCRHDINLLSLTSTLMKLRSEIVQQLTTFEFKDRMFMSIVDLLSQCIFLAISPQVKEAAMLCQRGDKKEAAVLHQFQSLVSMIQDQTVTWLQSSAPQLYGIGKDGLLFAIQKIMLLEPHEQYCRIDNFPPESERAFYMRIASEVPLLENTLSNLLTLKEEGITNAQKLDLVERLIRRAAQNSSETFPLLLIENIEIINQIFNLCMYQAPVKYSLPPGYVPPALAINNLYWKSWVILLIMAVQNPLSIGALAWERYPILRVFMEMCITNQFSYPPPTMALPEIIEEERAKELRYDSLEKQQILQYEAHLAAASTRAQISEQNSLLLPSAMMMDPTSIARRPPTNVLELIQSLNTTHRLGHLLCRSRKPDFLLDIIQRQQVSSSQNMLWLADLVQSSEGSLSQLPVQCLCEYLLSSTGQSDKRPRQKQLLSHLQTLLTDPLQDTQHSYEILEYFLRRLSSQTTLNRAQAIKGLKLILKTFPIDEESMDVDDGDNESWLLRKLPLIPHFPAVRLLVSKALRSACQVENNPDLVQAYISYLADYTYSDELTDLVFLVNELSQLVVERNTIVAAILPQPDCNSVQGRQTLHAFLSIYTNYLNKARAPRQDGSRVTWLENQDLILVQWDTGEECTMHILVVHAMVILLTYDQVDNDDLFDQLLEIWFPKNHDPPKAYLVDTGEEALLIPDWLKLRMIRSNIPRLVDAALRELEAYQLVLFVQSFGVPVDAMTKLLHLLDAAVQVDPVSVTNNVLDKTYMAQLVKILHNRGATGGSIFLEHVQLQTQKQPDKSASLLNLRLESLPRSTILQKRNMIQSNAVKSDIPNLINQLFIEKISMGQKNDCYRVLHKILAKDLYESKTDRGAVAVAIKHILDLLNSIQVTNFLTSFVHMSQYSCTLMRVILMPLKKPSNCLKTNELANMANTMCLNLMSYIGNVNVPIMSILHDFIKIRAVPNRYNRDPNDLVKLNKPGPILENAEPDKLENVGRRLLNLCIKQQRNDALVEAMAKLLVTDSEQGIKPRTGLLIDWLASVEPELIGTCHDLQTRLLFGKTNVYIRIDESIVRSHSCRPYLLTLLAHGVSWATLHKCVGQLLNQCHHGYDPTAVLDFVWALTCNPKLWQGREKCSTKNDMPENILLLTSYQLVVLVMYLIEEAVILCERENRKTAVTQMEARLDLMTCCCSSEDEIMVSVVKYLADQMTNRCDDYSDMAHQFLLLLYMKIPKVISYLSRNQSKRMMNGANISEWTNSTLDCMTHTLLSALTTLPRQKTASTKARELDQCIRKMSAVHPLLMLRQLPLLASTLTGICDLDSREFRAGYHANLFSQIMGVLELLQPHVFNQEHRKGLEDTLDNYLMCFKNFHRVEDLSSVLDRFALFLQAYAINNEKNALKYLQKHAQTLHELQSYYLGFESLKTLVAGIPLPREGESRDNLLVLNFNFSFHTKEKNFLPSHWPALLATLSKIQGDDVYNALLEIENISSRKPNLLEPIVDNLTDLFLSPQGSVRTLAHLLVTKALKYRPFPNPSVLAAFQRCLDNSRSDILMTALDKLPDYVMSMQEYALPLMQKVFELGVNSNVNIISYITKAIALLNMQKGC